MLLAVQVKRHMDLGTLLHHIDHHMYPTTAPFLADVALIPDAWALYYEVGCWRDSGSTYCMRKQNLSWLLRQPSGTQSNSISGSACS